MPMRGYNQKVYVDENIEVSLNKQKQVYNSFYYYVSFVDAFMCGQKTWAYICPSMELHKFPQFQNLKLKSKCLIKLSSHLPLYNFLLNPQNIIR